ncbi:hypothetical protein LTR49_028126 [Elasticomyces elasticus]|nr:hypothetical protein LTR49_028126 [Elasticomyces elasticus]
MAFAGRDLESNKEVAQSSLARPEIHSFAWKNVSIPKNKGTDDYKVLAENSGIVKAGELVAIVGPSGSGKSSLLKALSRRPGAMKCEAEAGFFINGVRADSRYIRQVSGYVDQDDALVGSLTVRETLDFSARLSLPKDIDTKQREQRVQALFEHLGLEDQSESSLALQSVEVYRAAKNAESVLQRQLSPRGTSISLMSRHLG